MKTKIFLTFIFACLGFILITSLNSQKVAAATCTWVGGSGTNWSTIANWDGNCSGVGGIPANGDSLTFDTAGAIGLTNNDISNLTLDQINISDVYTLTGNAITIATGLDCSQLNTGTIQIDITMAANTNITNCTMENTTALNNFDLTLDYTDNYDYGGNLVGTGNINVENTFNSNYIAFQFTGTNTFIGDVSIDQVILSLLTSTDLGPSTNTLSSNNSLIDLNTDIPYDISATGSSIRSFNANYELSGTLTSNPFSALSLITVGSGEITVTGVLTGPGGFYKFGSSTLTLANTVDNTFGGGFTITGGTVISQANGIAIPDFLSIGDDTGGPQSASFIANGSNQIADNAFVTMLSDGFIDMQGNSDTFAQLSMAEGLVDVNDGTLVVSDLQMIGGTINTGIGAINVTNSVSLTGGISAPSTINGQLDLGAVIGGIDFTGADTGMFPDGLINATIVGTSDINYLGGDITFAGNNTESGNIVMAGGYLVLEDANLFNLITQNGGFIHVHGDSSFTDFIQTDGSLWSRGTTGNVTFNSSGILFSDFTVGDELGIAHVGGDLNMDGLSDVEVFIDGHTRGTQYSAMDIDGTFNINDTGLAAINAGFVPTPGDTFIIAQAANIVGTFKNQPDGSTFIGMNNIYFRINYTGTQVILTAVAAPVDPLAPTGINLPINFMAITLLLTLVSLAIIKKYYY